MCRRPNSREQIEGAVQHDVDDGAPARSGSCPRRAPGSCPAALLTSTSGSPSCAVSRVEGGRDLRRAGGRRPAARAPARRWPRSPATPRARCSAPRERIATSAPRRANSTAIALPRPVPPPVTSTTSRGEGAERQRVSAELGRFRQSHGILLGVRGVVGARVSARKPRSARRRDRVSRRARSPGRARGRRDRQRRAPLPRRGARRRRDARTARGAQRAHARHEGRAARAAAARSPTIARSAACC